ncbi:hypothetical protein CEUSTIGMA_g11200.t1 [Chlamydomonas eustigma]|uniref:N-acetyltransferase domain-containing protein n=1 Tax=Chlamydomonas eustigma TaxID=1157962 RepID=A0A250XKZ7_9CHLO|nr:hypothetical protein CEUSTIGMA_g11200.t1 [Chlamydomonas eustigma]|eukprot:GAX83775.1 hypothetical protein CEUSTIGMA_g11200.t1 [Chlamydomonas eustigma]
MGSLEEKLSRLPTDLRDLVQSLPPEQAAQILDKLIQSASLTFRALNEQDVESIKTRTKENSAFGFLSADVDFTWQELQNPGYIALGMFDERADGDEVVIGFVIAEVSRLDETKEFYWEQDSTNATDSQPPPDAATTMSASTFSHQGEADPQSSSHNAGLIQDVEAIHSISSHSRESSTSRSFHSECSNSVNTTLGDVGIRSGNHNSDLEASGSPEPDHNSDLEASGSPEPDHNSALEASGSPEPDHNSDLEASGSPEPDHKSDLEASESPEPDQSQNDLKSHSKSNSGDSTSSKSLITNSNQMSPPTEVVVDGREEVVTVLDTSQEMQALLQAGGWSPSDIIVSIYYIGVDFEYRRQGLGQQLLDLVKKVALGARARMMWLHVAEYNPSAISFYTKYGFQKTEEVKIGQRGNHLMLVYPLASNSSRKSDKHKMRSSKISRKGRGFGNRSVASVSIIDVGISAGGLKYAGLQRCKSYNLANSDSIILRRSAGALPVRELAHAGRRSPPVIKLF